MQNGLSRSPFQAIFRVAVKPVPDRFQVDRRQLFQKRVQSFHGRRIAILVVLDFNLVDGRKGGWKGCMKRVYAKKKNKKKKEKNEKNLKRVMVRDGICVSSSFYVIYYPILAPIPNFIQIGRKTQKLKNIQ